MANEILQLHQHLASRSVPTTHYSITEEQRRVKRLRRLLNMALAGRFAGAFLRTSPLRVNSGIRRAFATESEVKAASQIERIEARLPNFLRRFTRPLRTAPISHITAFVILHELTAIVPLFGLAAFFHYSNWLPPYISEGRWVQQGTERFGKWLRKRGFIDAQDDRRSKWFGRSEGGVRIAVEFATAYAITKALLPLRLPLSIWMTPWFARWTVLPLRNRVAAMFRSRKSTTTSLQANATVSKPAVHINAAGTTAAVDAAAARASVQVNAAATRTPLPSNTTATSLTEQTAGKLPR